MSVATDPKIEQNVDSDDGFDKAFEEFAAAKSGQAPAPKEPEEDGEPEGNGPEGEAATPEGETSPKAAEPETPTDDATSGEAKADGGTQPPEDQAPDPFATLPDDVRAKIAEIEKERDDARHRASSDANRVAALSRKLQQLQTPAPSATAPEAEKSEAQKALDDKIKQLREDYGDIADPLVELIEQQRQELSTVRTVLTGLSEERQAQVIAAETQALEARHPDWRNIAQSPDFAQWLAIQPPNIQGLAESWDARETSVVLTLFKSEKAETTGQGSQKPAATDTKPDAATGARRSQQLEGSRDTRSRPAPAASEAPDDFDAAFEFFRKKREAQVASARR